MIVAAVIPRNEPQIEKDMLASGEKVKCPLCAELIRPEAVKCRYCGSDVLFKKKEIEYCGYIATDNLNRGENVKITTRKFIGAVMIMVAVALAVLLFGQNSGAVKNPLLPGMAILTLFAWGVFIIVDWRNHDDQGAK